MTATGCATIVSNGAEPSAQPRTKTFLLVTNLFGKIWHHLHISSLHWQPASSMDRRFQGSIGLRRGISFEQRFITAAHNFLSVLLLQNVGGTARAIAKSSMLPTRRNFANNYNCTQRINSSGSSRCCESSANLSVSIFHRRSSFGGVDNSDSSTLGSREVGSKL